MNLVSRFSLIMAVISLACSDSKKQESGGLAFDLKNIRVESAGGCTNDTNPCASFVVIYPEFKNLGVEVSDKLLDKINLSIAYDNPETEGFSIEQLGEEFVASYENFTREMPDHGMGWYFKTEVMVNIASDTLISLEAVSEYFTGGAHGGYAIYFVNIDSRNGDEVTLGTYLKPGYGDMLNSAGEHAFRLTRGLSETDNLAEHGFEFRDGRFSLNGNYGFRPEGIVFFFNNYEIAAYASGPTELVIPWEVLKEWRK